MQQHKESKLHISKANAPFQVASEPRRYVTKLRLSTRQRILSGSSKFLRPNL